MNKRNNHEGAIKRMLSATELCAYTGLGKRGARKFADIAGATKKFGGRVLFDRVILDEALDKMPAESIVES